MNARLLSLILSAPVLATAQVLPQPRPPMTGPLRQSPDLPTVQSSRQPQVLQITELLASQGELQSAQTTMIRRLSTQIDKLSEQMKTLESRVRQLESMQPAGRQK